MDDLPELLKMIFPDSKIVGEITLKRSKLSYVINYGLKEYYHEKCMEKVKQASRFTICSDEAVNNISCRKQLGSHVLYFDEHSQKVERYYSGSAFMGHGDTETCLKKLIETMKNLDYTNNLLQALMGGPNINWKLLEFLKVERTDLAPDILALGSCGLHVLHCI